MLDYIIVGCGIAGIAFAETCIQNGKSVMVFDNSSQKSSTIAGGLYNPVILKRFSGFKDAQLQIDELNKFNANLQSKLKVQFDYKTPILRKFFSIEEQNSWFAASDKPELAPFLSLDIIKSKFLGITSPYDYGKVLQAGYVDTKVYLEAYKQYLILIDSFSNTSFEYNKLELFEDKVNYLELNAKNIVFAEGFGMHANPYFKYLPLDGTKGELFIIKCLDLDLNVIINTSVFIIPLGNHLFKVGATYNWSDKTDHITEEGKEELISKIKEILNCDFEIVFQFAAVRPTVKDRKPLIGTHIKHSNMHIMNGLGTRGVVLAPLMAKSLYNYIEKGISLETDIDIKRFAKLYD